MSQVAEDRGRRTELLYGPSQLANFGVRNGSRPAAGTGYQIRLSAPSSGSQLQLDLQLQPVVKSQSVSQSVVDHVTRLQLFGFGPHCQLRHQQQQLPLPLAPRSVPPLAPATCNLWPVCFFYCLDFLAVRKSKYGIAKKKRAEEKTNSKTAYYQHLCVGLLAAKKVLCCVNRFTV